MLTLYSYIPITGLQLPHYVYKDNDIPVYVLLLSDIDDNLGYIHSVNGNIRYKVYLWGFSCLDYPFDILISWIRQLSLYNWFCRHLHSSNFCSNFMTDFNSDFVFWILIRISNACAIILNLLICLLLIFYWICICHLLLFIAFLHELSIRYTFQYTCICLCTSLGFILCAWWVIFWQPLDLHVQIPEREIYPSCGALLQSGSVVDQ